MLKLVLSLAIAGALTGSAVSAQTDTARLKVIEGDPKFVSQQLRLVDVPEAAGPSVSLFNGRDLDDWETWLGYEDPALTYLPDPARPIGAGQGKGTMFKVVEVDGAPALYVNGKTWGSIVHKQSFENYHLRMQFKWGPTRYAPRVNLPQNNGLLYHSNGEHGSVYGTWMPAVEFEIMRGSTGMVVPVGKQIGVRTFAGHDPAIEYPKRRFMIGGREVSVEAPAWNVEAARDVERPVGEWNTLDLYVFGDRAIHVVNGVPVMELHGLSIADPKTGNRQPLTRGRIQFQSEGAETYFRNITVTPISKLPRIVQE